MKKISLSNNKKRKVKNLMGSANNLFNEQKVNEAGELCQKALKIDPNHADSFNLLGLISSHLKKYDSAEIFHKKACELMPNNPLYWNNLGALCLTLKRYTEAQNYLNKSLEVEPGYFHALSNMSALLLELKQPEKAYEILQHVLAAQPKSSFIQCLMGEALGQLNLPHKATQYFLKALQLNPNEKNANIKLGQIYLNNGELSKAEEYLRKELYYYPETGACYQALVMSKLHNDQDISKLQRLYKQSNLPLDDRISVIFSLARIKEYEKDYEQSFTYLNQANKLRRDSLQCDLNQHAAYFERLKESFSISFIQNKSRISHSSATPIFILGLPRSGTSLVEQILVSHPSVAGCGELDNLGAITQQICNIANTQTDNKNTWNFDSIQWEEAGQAYLDVLYKLAESKAPFITDKTPLNFQYIGFIHSIFPNAKIIHCHRNRMDNCLSIYKEGFTGTAYNYAYNLEELGAYYLLYEDLMAHWRSVLPDGTMYELEYETLVNHQESETRALLQHCNIEWDNACLSFHQTKRHVNTASTAQVRQPIYKTSIEGWRRYEKQLQPLAKILLGNNE